MKKKIEDERKERKIEKLTTQIVGKLKAFSIIVSGNPFLPPHSAHHRRKLLLLSRFTLVITPRRTETLNCLDYCLKMSENEREDENSLGKARAT